MDDDSIKKDCVYTLDTLNHHFYWCIEPNENVLYCDVCGKNMVWDDGVAFIGMSITINNEVIEHTEFVQSQLGGYQIGKTYNACFECWLKSLGFKP